MTGIKKVALVLMMVLICCTSAFAQAQLEKPIYVLYTNDVHCGIDENIGYAGLYTVKSNLEAQGEYVTLVDNGDAIQGDSIGTVSRGSYLVDIMNEVGYDFAVFGNHEFDYGLDRLSELMEKSNAQYLACNITYTGKGTNLLAAAKPYEIVSYGPYKVAYIGVATPESIVKSTPKYFMEDGEFVYHFAEGEELYKCVMDYVMEAREKGVDYVVVLSHLGDEEGSAPNRSLDLIANTYAIDVVLDAHSHNTVESLYVKNLYGLDVLYSQTGTKLQTVGVLKLQNYNAETKLITQAEKDADVTAYIDSIKAEYEGALNAVVAHSDVLLTGYTAEGGRLVRNRETNIGDLCADAYRALADADIAFVNGGGIRADIKAGDITTNNMIAVHPYGNMLCACYATGQQIIDALEWGSRNTMAQATDGKSALGENGGFLQVSGLKYTIDTSIENHCVMDENNMFAYVDGERRVKDVMVGSEEEGWAPIELDKTYKLASHNYMLQDMGDGYTMFADNEYPLNCTMLDNQVIINYICDYLGGIVDERYAQPQGRITVL